jgi:hypothetical protein
LKRRNLIVPRRAGVLKPRQISPRETEIAERPGWVLTLNERSHGSPWLPLRLRRTVPDRKVSYWIGYHADERRFAGGHDIAILRQHEPEIAEWVLDEVERWLAFE